MHADEIDTDVELVRRLLAGQLPHWAEPPIEPAVSYGTDHDIYRLGDELAVRLPRIGWATEQAAKEQEWLPRLAPHLPLAVSVQLAMGSRRRVIPSRGRSTNGCRVRTPMARSKISRRRPSISR